MKQKLIELTEKRILREMYEDEKALKNMLSMETVVLLARQLFPYSTYSSLTLSKAINQKEKNGLRITFYSWVHMLWHTIMFMKLKSRKG